jgi:acetyl esterase/lipase
MTQDRGGIDRRTLMVLGAAIPAVPAVAAATEPNDPTEVVRLWPGDPPGSPARRPQERIVDRAATSGFRDRAVTGIGTPTLTLFRPSRPNGAAILILPGGGYARVVLDKEAHESARRFNEAGITAFVLRYRLPGEGWAAPADTPLQDAQRAMRIIRGNAGRYRIDPRRVAVIGFSAGGHLAASLATRFAVPLYDPADDADRASPRPDLVALLYPVVTMSGPHVHAGSRDLLLGSATDPRAAIYSPHLHVDARTPPVFLAHASDDDAVPVENSLMMFAALREKKVPSELHVFQEGGHGFGLRLVRGKPAAAWPDLFLAWARRHRFLE